MVFIMLWLALVHFLFLDCFPSEIIEDIIFIYQIQIFCEQVRVSDPIFLGYFIEMGAAVAAKVVQIVN